MNNRKKYLIKILTELKNKNIFYNLKKSKIREEILYIHREFIYDMNNYSIYKWFIIFIFPDMKGMLNGKIFRKYLFRNKGKT